jgi:hypothetical protein
MSWRSTRNHWEPLLQVVKLVWHKVLLLLRVVYQDLIREKI